MKCSVSAVNIHQHTQVVFFFLVMRAFKLSLNTFQIWKTGLLTRVAVLYKYITSLWPTPASLYLVTIFTHVAHPCLSWWLLAPDSTSQNPFQTSHCFPAPHLWTTEIFAISCCFSWSLPPLKYPSWKHCQTSKLLLSGPYLCVSSFPDSIE